MILYFPCYFFKNEALRTRKLNQNADRRLEPLSRSLKKMSGGAVAGERTHW